MDDESDDLFVIDKSGGPSSFPHQIIYDFKENSELGSNTSPVQEPLARPPRRLITGKRYHEVDDMSRFRPGRLSNELREALSLAEHELPIHIYRMRTLGYPPGWLRKARVGDGLTIFDSVCALAENNDVTYNRDALISYPGFNTSIEYPYVDECETLNCPRMQHHHMLDNFYAALSRSERTQSVEVGHYGSSSRSGLGKLWAERERILAEIRQLDTKIGTKQAVAEAGDIECTDGIDNSLKNAHNVRTTTDSSISDANDGNSTGQRVSEVLIIDSVENGTPTPTLAVVTEGSPAAPSSVTSVNTKKPEIDAFTVGVQPFKPFENLPGSHGSYKRVLETLRNSRFNSSPTVSSHDSSYSDISGALSSSSSKSSTPHTHQGQHRQTHCSSYSRSNDQRDSLHKRR